MTGEPAAELPSTRYGTLPPRVAFEDLVATQAVPADRRPAFDPDDQAARFACLAADLGL